MVRLVAPGERGDVARDLAQDLRMLEHAVGPALDPSPAVARETVHGEQEVKIDASLPPRLAGRARSSGADVERLVEADVERRAPEAGQELVVEPGQELETGRVRRAQAERLLREAERVLDAL